MSSREGKEGIVKAVEAFKKLAEIPSVASAEVSRCADEKEDIDVRLNLSARSYASHKRTTQRCNIRLSSGKVISYNSTPSTDSSDDTIKASFSSLPESESNWVVVLRESSGKNDKGKKRAVELWKEERRFASVDVTEHHGEFNTDETFGSFSIYEDMVLYSAEANPPLKEVKITARKERDDLQDWEYKAPLGEKFGGKAQPTVFLLRFSRNTNEEATLCSLAVDAAIKDQSLSSALFGQAVFSSSGENVFLTAYPTLQDGRRMGIVICSNRPAVIYKISLWGSAGGNVTNKESVRSNPWKPQDWLRLSPKTFSARSPRSWFGGMEESCFWLQSEEGGAHQDCQSLALYRGEGFSEEVPIQAIPDGLNGWPGLFLNQLRRSCCLVKVKGLAIDTIWGSRKTIVVHKFGSKSPPIEVTPLGNRITINQDAEDENILWSYTLLCTDGIDTIVATRSSLTRPQQILVGSIKPDGKVVEWIIVKRLVKEWQDEAELQSLVKMRSSIEEVKATQSSAKGDLAVQIVVLQGPKSTKDTPCILFPHGGPHSASTNDWSPSIAALCLQGYTIVMPNYHGSLGRGQQFAHSLIGKCGKLDVDDCVACVNYLIETDRAKKGNLFVQGGSHGGFLSVHLVGKYPKMFQRAIVRNPVIAAGVMEGTTDIPDWCYSEFGLNFPFHDTLPPPFLSTKEYEQLQLHSPINQIDNIETPMLILLGMDDKRVPPNQSKILYHRLLSREKQVKMLTFEGQGHALDGVECELIAWEATLRWLNGDL